MGPEQQGPRSGAEASWNTGMGGGAPPSPPSPARARDTTTRCKQKRLPRPPGGGGRLGRQPVGQWAKAGARPAHMPSPGARDGGGAPKREGQEIGQTWGPFGTKGPPWSPVLSRTPSTILSLPPTSLLIRCPAPRPFSCPGYSRRSQPSCGVGAPGSG